MSGRRNPQPAPEDVAVYAGRTFAGGVTRRPGGFVARDPDGRKVGVYTTQREASSALIEHAAQGGPA